jgi:hypothetical protein
VKVRLGLAGVALAGCLGGCSGHAEVKAPNFLEVHFPGSYSEPGTVAVPGAGDYAIWADGSPSPDAKRCSVATDAGAGVPVTAPDGLTTYTAKDEDDAVFTVIARFSASAAGTYTVRCAPDPKAPGASLRVSSVPR